MTTQSSILVLKILWTERPGRLQSMVGDRVAGVGGSHKRVELNLVTKQQQQKQKYNTIELRGDIKKHDLK